MTEERDGVREYIQTWLPFLWETGIIQPIILFCSLSRPQMCTMKPLTPALALLMSLVLAIASTEMVTFYGSEVDGKLCYSCVVQLTIHTFLCERFFFFKKKTSESQLKPKEQFKNKLGFVCIPQQAVTMLVSLTLC